MNNVKTKLAFVENLYNAQKLEISKNKVVEWEIPTGNLFTTFQFEDVYLLEEFTMGHTFLSIEFYLKGQQILLMTIAQYTVAKNMIVPIIFDKIVVRTNYLTPNQIGYIYFYVHKFKTNDFKNW